MSQPPSRPPQGGFGAPQEPPQGPPPGSPADPRAGHPADPRVDPADQADLPDPGSPDGGYTPTLFVAPDGQGYAPYADGRPEPQPEPQPQPQPYEQPQGQPHQQQFDGYAEPYGSGQYGSGPYGSGAQPQTPPVPQGDPWHRLPTLPGPYAQGPYDPASYGQTPYGQAPSVPSVPSPYGPSGYGGTAYGQVPPGPGPVPGQQGPYGAPQPFPYTPAPQPPSGGRKGLRGRAGVIVAGAVAALLVVGGGTYLALSGGGGDGDGGNKGSEAGRSGGPAPTASTGGEGSGGAAPGTLDEGRKDGEAKVSFVTVNDVDLPRSGVDAFGPWVAGDTVVRAVYRQVTGVSRTDGRKKWTIPFDTDICSATFHASDDGKVVVGVKDGTGERAECLRLRMIDLRTGEVGWERTLKPGAGFGSLTDFTLTISGNTLGAAGLGNSFGFSLTDGRQLFAGPATGCKPFAFAGGPRLLAAANCPSTDLDKPRHRLQELDPETGRAKWTYSAPEGWEVEKVFSADPVVVSLKQTREKKWGVVALTDRGTERSRIQGGADRFQPRCGGNFVVLGEHLEGCIGVAADDRALYLATQPDRPGGPNEIVAFDLDSGKPKWRTPSGGESTLMPLRMEGSDVLAYREPGYDRGGELTTVAPGGGAPRTLLKLQDATARTESGFYRPRLVYQDGTFLIAGGRISARDDTEERRTPTMMAVTR
ncbi:outer membrane protein assembly factor BamB family protein [Streptomyces yaizuensis]|uniref:PQQ-binding-like beta-propeller repeat protein n=1 Tax=Streptomyces yaizuensis TaxID=2989713 RepID=A0ABQ5PA76_9ACTN|nr:PQQ-binding-like beta-propeller repeat protein [Streptomyces sp. YSPA8]GLF99395.1 PQQ-binding-like beta-propeller repeat protein [Streptomyces sp. YSPA8]